MILEAEEIHVERDYIGLFVVLLGIWGVEPVSGLDRADQEASKFTDKPEGPNCISFSRGCSPQGTVFGPPRSDYGWRLFGPRYRVV